MALRVVVASPTPDCVAHRTLALERVQHDLLLCEGEEGYGEYLAALWADGEGFVLVEHDIAPWPGAVGSLQDCDQPWCAFPYHYPDLKTPQMALGCTKFSASLIRERPELPETWRGTSWRGMDGTMLHALRTTMPGWPGHIPHPHEHGPPVAHARGEG